MIGQVIRQTLGLSLLTSGASEKASEIEATNPEQQSQPEKQEVTAEQSEVAISDLAKQLSLNLDDDEPDWKQVQAMASQLSSTMESLFLKAGIDTSAPIRINIHPYTGTPFVGEHPDKGRIQRLLDETPDILQQIKNVNTVASYSYQISQSNYGVSSSATPMATISTQHTTPEHQAITHNKLHSALEQYEQTIHTTRISMEYKHDMGISLDVLSPSKARRQLPAL